MESHSVEFMFLRYEILKLSMRRILKFLRFTTMGQKIF